MDKRRKKYVSHISPVQAGEDDSAVIKIQTDSRRKRIIDHSDWLGREMDGVVFGFMAQLRKFVNQGDLSIETILGYGRSLRLFYFHLQELGNVKEVCEITPAHLESFIRRLKDQYPTRTSAKTVYESVKPVILEMIECGKVEFSREDLPRNPFPGSNSDMVGATPLSSSERESLASALRKDLIALHHGYFNEPDSEALSVYVLLLAIRTGTNTTPLLKLSRSCLKPHPFLPNIFLLQTFKARGNATHHKVLRYSEEIEESKVVKADAVAILQKVLERTEPLREDAPSDIADSVWLYRSRRRYDDDRVTRLTEWMLATSIRNIVSRHSLVGDDGKRLKVNLNRLRKTLAERVWMLSNGDLNVVASILGNSPEVADQSYLSVTERMRKEATTVSESLVSAFKAGTLVESGELTSNRTPVGRCVDSLGGEFAPKDGVTHCEEFLHCISCSAFAITRERADLHRLFSFIWYLYQEQARHGSQEWRSFFEEKISLLERLIQDAFSVEEADMARTVAFMNPLGFWKAYSTKSVEELHA